MPVITIRTDIKAPADAVFRAVSDIEHFPDTAPNILDVEFLTEQRSGVGTRFRERREMNGEVHVTELEMTEYDPDDLRVRMVTDTHGTVWDTVVRVQPAGDGCQVRFEMDCRGSTWVKRVMNVVMQPLFRRGMQSHVDALVLYCEGRC